MCFAWMSAAKLWDAVINVLKSVIWEIANSPKIMRVVGSSVESLNKYASIIVPCRAIQICSVLKLGARLKFKFNVNAATERCTFNVGPRKSQSCMNYLVTRYVCR